MQTQQNLQSVDTVMMQRLANKGFVDRAPKDIVDQEKTNYNNLENNIKRILITIESL